MATDTAGIRWTALAALLAHAVVLCSSSPASHGLDPLPRTNDHKRSNGPRGAGAVGRKAAMGERSQWEVGGGERESN